MGIRLSTLTAAILIGFPTSTIAAQIFSLNGPIGRAMWNGWGAIQSFSARCRAGAKGAARFAS